MWFGIGPVAARIVLKVRGLQRAEDEAVPGDRLARLVARRKEVDQVPQERLSLPVVEKRAAPLYDPVVYGTVNIDLHADTCP